MSTNDTLRALNEQHKYLLTDVVSCAGVVPGGVADSIVCVFVCECVSADRIGTSI